MEDVWHEIDINKKSMLDIERDYPECFSPPVMAPIASEINPVATLDADDISRLNLLYGCATPPSIIVPDIRKTWTVSFFNGALNGSLTIDTETNVGSTSNPGAITGSGSFTIPGGPLAGTYSTKIISGSVGVYDGITRNLTVVTKTNMGVLCGNIITTAKGIASSTLMTGIFSSVSDLPGAPADCIPGGSFVAM